MIRIPQEAVAPSSLCSFLQCVALEEHDKHCACVVLLISSCISYADLSF